MKLRNLLTAVCLLVVTAVCKAAPEKPIFSDAGSDHWYYIVFTAGDAAVADQGDGKRVLTQLVKPDRETQWWKFVGTPDNFKIVGKNGNYLYCEDYVTASSDPAKASEFKLVASANPAAPDSWEIEYSAKGDDMNHWNQWGKTGTGVSIGLYSANEYNNPLTFIPKDVIATIPVFNKISEFKTLPSTGYKPENRHTLWYTNPVTAETVADPWMEYALPIGNGDFGGMVYGGIAQDNLQFNDKSLWTGNTQTRGCYQSFGNLYIEDITDTFGNSDDKAAKDYVRDLDMRNAKANVSYTSPDGKIRYTREYIASYPDKAIAVRLAASEAGKISVRLRLFSGVRTGILATSYKDGEACFEGRLDHIDFKAKAKVFPTGGNVISKDDCIEVNGADELLIILAGATDYDMHSPTYLGSIDKMSADVDDRVSKAGSKGWESILKDHIADFSQYFDRAEFRIDAAANDRTIQDMVTNYNKRRVSPTEPCNLMLEELYYAYGRYLLISSSRGMDLPANLQGIWNHSNSPAWQCDIHSNINVQMNYWPAEPTNLSEMHFPYLNYIYSMVTEHGEWKEYARRSGQTKGWTCFTQNNIFGHSDYAENYVIANAWYASHLWQHYLYTLDKDFLMTKALPVMISCCEFWLERLVKDSTGMWVAPKEWSPEHGPAEEDATAHAQQIIYELFKTTLQAIEISGMETAAEHDFIGELREKLESLDKGLAIETYTGAWGATSNGISAGDPILREWKTSDYTAGENGHRHQSHLMAMYPYGEITPESEWFTPAVNSLKQRGDISTGWSLAWRIALWARALDSEHAHTIIKNALRHATTYTQSSGGGGIYYNLFDSHAPFQIDGNFGYTAGVTEMLLQSYGGVIRLLPSLPVYWEGGSIRGIKGEGNFEIDQTWKKNRLTVASIKSGSGVDCRLNYKGIADAKITDSEGKEVVFTKIDENNISFPTVAGAVYQVEMNDNSGVAEVYDPEMAIRIENRVASVNLPDVTIKAYDLAGRLLLASDKSVLNLSDLDKGAIILKATSDNRYTSLKTIIE